MDFDVIVAGGGTAGVFAAIASARQGAMTLLFEAQSFLGGTQTASLVQPNMALGLSDNEYAGSINAELITRLQNCGVGQGYWFDPEQLKILLEDMCIESGCRLLYNTQVIRAEVDRQCIRKICVNTTTGVQEFSAQVFIDATGNGDLAFMAGAQYRLGNQGKCQPVSLRFEMGNIDIAAFSRYLQEKGQTTYLGEEAFETACTADRPWPLSSLFAQGLALGQLTKQDCAYFQAFSIPGRKGVLSFNCPEVGVLDDVLDPWDQTEAYIKGRQGIRRLVNFMKSTFPGFQDAYLGAVAPLLGIRDSRSIVGRETLTINDIVTYRKFSDGIMGCNYYVDVHGMPEEDIQFTKERREDVPKDKRYYTIPFGSLVPKGLDNLLVAGRCISADFWATAAVRIQLVCRGVGEAAGIAAALAVKQRAMVTQLDSQEVITLFRKTDTGEN